MEEVVLVEAVRTPIGRRKGRLAETHATTLLGTVQRVVCERAGVAPEEIGQVIGGCVAQVGMQTMNVTRNAWLAAGLPAEVPSTTVDAQCGSSQQAFTLAVGLVAAGIVDVALACGVEVMSAVPMGSNSPKDPFVGKPITRSYWAHHEYTTQFEAADRLAAAHGITRADCDAFGLSSQQRAEAAWTDERFATQIAEIPVVDDAGSTSYVARDECLRDTSMEALAALRPTLDGGVHTAGTSSQIADGASAVVLMKREVALRRGLTPLATVVDTALVGSDPTVMLTGPIHATEQLLARQGLGVGDLDLVEINEAFAAVVLAWCSAFATDLQRVNPNGGAISLGHPLGATGTMLIAKAAHELRRTGTEHALVTMCCAGGLGTATLLRHG
jgi:acetyl-CoA C-acetyltransferase